MSNPQDELKALEAKMRRTNKWSNRAFTALAVIMFALELFLTGYNLAKGNTQYTISNAIFAFFWGMFLFIQTRSWKLDLEMRSLDRDLENMLRVKELIDKITEDVVTKGDPHQDALAELLVDCVDQVTNQSGDGQRRLPTQADCDAAVTLFHEKTGDHYARLTVVDGGIKAEIQNKPFDEVPGRSTAHDAARVRGDKARKAGKSINGVERRLTPAQQRKRNEKAGKGAFTDDELREQRNAKRRADRAAKKAEANKSNNGQLPGQTELVPPETKE